MLLEIFPSKKENFLQYNAIFKTISHVDWQKSFTQPFPLEGRVKRTINMGGGSVLNSTYCTMFLPLFVPLASPPRSTALCKSIVRVYKILYNKPSLWSEIRLALLGSAQMWLTLLVLRVMNLGLESKNGAFARKTWMITPSLCYHSDYRSYHNDCRLKCLLNYIW